jgi:DNA-binding Xre family transcriptional regulator
MMISIGLSFRSVPWRPMPMADRRPLERLSFRLDISLELYEVYIVIAKAYKDLRDKVRSNPERVARVKTRRQAMEDALALAEIREKRELTQTDIAQVLEMSQANVSRIERQQNLYLSTLAEYVEALGGELKISAVFADEEVEIGVGREFSGQR